MGTQIEVTKVNKDASSISYTENGESKTANIVNPAQIKWAKLGKAEAGFNQEGEINFLRSLEPKPETNNANANNNVYKKPESKFRAISTMEVLDNVSLKEIKAVYDNINTTDHAKCGASTLFMRADGNYDAALYVTTFVRKELVNGPEI